MAADPEGKESLKIKAIMEMEEHGCSVSYFSADVTRLEEMKTVLDEARGSYNFV